MKSPYSQYITFIISRFELTPKDNPEGYLVGFKTCCSKNGLERYFDTVVKLKDAGQKSDHDICTLAYLQLKPILTPFLDTMLSVPSVVGAEFIPPG